MRQDRNLRSKYILLATLIITLLTLSGCRTRLSNNSDISTVHYDEGGFLEETYEARRNELGLSTAKKPIMPDFGSGETEDEGQDSYDDSNLRGYEAEEDTYTEPSSTTTTTNNNTRVVRSSGSTGISRGHAEPRRSSENEITITLDANGGTVDGEKTAGKTITKGSSIGALPEEDKVKREGYKFLGWFTKKDGGSLVKFRDVVNENTTLYAHWEKVDDSQTVKITFDGNGGTPETQTLEPKKGSTIGNPDTPKHPDENKEFIGWYTEKEGGKALESGTKATKDATYYARWKDKEPEKTKHTVTFVLGNGENDKSVEVEDGAAAEAPDNPERGGYTFGGWDKDFSNVTSDLTVTAIWDPDTSSVKYWNDKFEESKKNTKKKMCYVEGVDSGIVIDCNAEITDNRAEYVVVFSDMKDAEVIKETYKDTLNLLILPNEANKDDEHKAAYRLLILNWLQGTDTDYKGAAKGLLKGKEDLEYFARTE